MKHTAKRIVALLCAFVMLFSLFGSSVVFAADGEAENIALLKPAVATYEENGSNIGYAWKANDGNLSTRWSTSGDPDGGIPGAVQIDLEAESRIDSTNIYWFMDGRSFTYDIYVTDEPVIVNGEMVLTGLTPVVKGAQGTGSGNGTAGSAADAAKGTANTMPADTKGRYVTVVVTASGGTASVLWELEIYGEILGEIPPKNISSIGVFADIYVPFGTKLEDIALAQTASVTLENGKVEVVGLEWSGDYNANEAGEYTLTGTPVIGEDQNIANGSNVTASVTVVVADENATYEGRQKYNINKGWSFYRGTANGAEAVDYNDSAWTVLSLPHTWNAEDGQDGGNYYRGDGWYRKTINKDARFEGKQVVIEFLAANNQSWVYVNGTEVGHHMGGYTAFRYDITDLLVEGENVIAVKVNNQHDERIIPQHADFTFYGGLYRDVSLIVTDPVHIDTLDIKSKENSASSGLRLTTTDVSKESAKLNISSVIVNDSAVEKKVTVKAVLRHPDSFEEIPGVDPLFNVEDMYDPNGTVVAEFTEELTIAAGQSADFSKDYTLANPHLWNGLTDPYRYQVDLTVLDGDQVIDSVSDYVGFRFFDVDYNTGFYLNGESYNLRGVSRHQDREGMGNAITVKEHNEDFAMIYEMGCNAIRLAHYPQDPYFYELCDRYGIAVWAEIPFVDEIGGTGDFLKDGTDTRDANRVGFFEVTEQMLVELIRQQYNRPAILMWGLQNEVLRSASSGNNRDNGGEEDQTMSLLMDILNNRAHAEDPTRLTTQATDKDQYDDWASDIVAWNKYPGWYGNRSNELGKILDDLHNKDPRPIGISEYGAGAVVTQHEEPSKVENDTNCTMSFQTEEWANEAHEYFIEDINARDYLWGTFIWNMFDFFADGRDDGCGYPGLNTKGLVTADRTTKKDTFYLYKSHWSDTPTAYITSRRFTERELDKIQVKIYSNCESVELTVNGKVIGTMTAAEATASTQEHVFLWRDVALSKSVNEVSIKAIHADGTVVTDEVTWINPNITPGDLNGDRRINVVDIIALQNMILDEAIADDLAIGDLNGDGALTVADIVKLKELILNPAS